MRYFKMTPRNKIKFKIYNTIKKINYKNTHNLIHYYLYIYTNLTFLQLRKQEERLEEYIFRKY